MTSPAPTGAAALVRQAAGTTVASLFAAMVRLYPGRIAITGAGGSISYAQLGERVRRTAAALAALDPHQVRRFAILSENRAEYLEIQLAAASLGAMLACQNWRLTVGELRGCLELAEPAVAVASPRHAEALGKVGLRGAAVLTLGPEWEARLAAAGPPPSVRIDPEAPFLVLYTGGTTGTPKGAVLTQRSELARMMVMGFDLGLRSGGTNLAWPPLFHMGGSEPALHALLTGGRVLVEDGFDAGRIAAHLAVERFDWVSIQPGAQGKLIQAIEAAGRPVLGVGRCGVMADLVPPADLARMTTLLAAPWCNTFGATETGTPPLSAGLVAPGDATPDLGKWPSPFAEIRLLNADGQDVAAGEVGELAMRGPTLFSGYWRDDATTSADFRDGWFHMGDLFRRRPDGRFDFVDRAKYMIKSGGENIYPAEIERVLLADPDVADAVVVKLADARWGEVPVALVEARVATLDTARLLAACRAALAGYKLPKRILLVSRARIGRSQLGKVARRGLEQWVANGATPD